MDNLAKLYRAKDQLEHYRRRGLKPQHDAAVFSEMSIAKGERPTDCRTRSLVRSWLASLFRPTQPQLD